ncbi:MAG: extracellular solute-binding protein [Alphaproteobacteria bacterium]|nr:extracellular solute-binding protein [Alphaproteobacteria bacterium]
MKCIVSGVAVALLSGALVVGSVPAAGAAEIGKTLEEVIALASKEGTVHVANTWRGEVLKEVAKGVKKKYGIAFKQTRASGIASRERILNEAMAGLNEYDVVNVSGELRPQYIRAGIIVKVAWGKLFPKVRPMLIDPQGYFLAAGISRYGFIYNHNMVSAAEAPKTWEDCLDPKWKGRMAVYTRPRTFTGLWPGWGEAKSLAFHRKLKDNGPIWTTDQTSTGAKIAAGEYPFSCGLPYHTFLNVKRRDKAAPITFVIPPELPVQIGEAFAIMKGARNPNAAILFAGYLASSEGQKAYTIYGRSNPFVDGSFASQEVEKAKAKIVFGGWDFAGAKEGAAAKKIVEAWGFTKGRK